MNIFEYFLEKINIKIFILFLILYIKQINTYISKYSKTICLSNNNYFIINTTNIIFYNSSNSQITNLHTFDNEQIINSDKDIEMIHFGTFADLTFLGLIIVKHYSYAISDIGHMYSNANLTEIKGCYSLFLIPIKCITTDCYYIIGIIDSNSKLYLYLYTNDANTLISTFNYRLEINGDSENFICHLLDWSTDNVKIICFYENNTSKEIISSDFIINLSNKTIEQISSISSPNNGGKVIKSYLFSNNLKAFVCYIDEENNYYCQIYDINNNQWSNNSIIYLTNCLPSTSSLNIDYIDSSNEYLLFCFQSSTSFNLIKLNETFEIINSEENGVYKINDSLINQCNEYSLISLVKNSNTNNIDYSINCDNHFLNYQIQKIYIIPTTILFQKSSIILKPLIQSSLLISSQIKKSNIDNEIIIQKMCYKAKEEIIDNLNEFMKDYDSEKIYEIFGNNYEIKISPINTNKYKNISTFINFTNCENILRESNKLSPSDILTVYQIEIDNKYEQSLINEIEYAVFYEKNKRIDLSVCKDETIEINYQIKNISLIDKTKIYYYSEIGVDIFNSSDKFFNDICYPYSEDNSDLILKDRIADIYENYSICEGNCEYKGINITQNTINCHCSIKTNVDTNVEPPHFDEIIIDTFTDSNIGVIKCYKLVFNMSNKNKNIGFWIFTILILLHIPIYIHYFRFNIKSIQQYIYSELHKFGYWRYSFNPIKKDSSKVKIRNSIKIKSNTENDKSVITMKRKSFNPKLKYMNPKQNNELLDNYSKIDCLRKSDLSNNNNSKFDESKKSLKFLKKTDRKILKNGIINKRKSASNPILLFNYNVYNKNYINMKKTKNIQNTINNSQKNYKINKENEIQFFPEKYYLIHIDANNTCKKEPPYSNIILDNYEYETAIKYEKRSFFRIFYICLLSKENIIKLIFFKNNPLSLPIMQLSLFIFINSSDLAFNTIFFSNQNISDKYHYEGNDLFYFTLVNNIVQIFTSTTISFILNDSFEQLIDSKGDFEDIFRKEEDKMRKDKKYKVNKKRKIEILKTIKEILTTLKYKIIIFLIIEFFFMLIFWYFVTAFCEVYQKTQISWIEDYLFSFLLSLATEIFVSWVIAIFYIMSIRYKLKFIYKIVLFFYNL